MTPITVEEFRRSQWPGKRAKGRTVRRQAGVMNKTETAYSGHLDSMLATGRVLWWRFEGLTLKLAPDLRWTPDFSVMLDNGEIELHDTKGHFEDHARAKMLAATQLFPFAVVKVERQGKGWKWTYLSGSPRVELTFAAAGATP